jgi:hypothetical protein
VAVAFYNYVVVGASNDNFNDGAGRTIASGMYRFDEFAEAFLDAAGFAGRRLTLSDQGFVTIDSNGGANFAITWTDTALRDFLGYTGNLAAANTYAAPRRVRGAWHSTFATLAEFDPVPTGAASQRRSRGGLTRSTWQGRIVDEVEFYLQFLSNDRRLTSPAGASGITYQDAGSADPGLTEYAHARDFWFDATSAANQGFSDGRPVVFFEDETDVGFTMDSAAAPAWDSLSSGTFTTWVVGVDALARLRRDKVLAGKRTHYHLRLPAVEYVEP